MTEKFPKITKVKFSSGAVFNIDQKEIFEKGCKEEYDTLIKKLDKIRYKSHPEIVNDIKPEKIILRECIQKVIEGDNDQLFF